MNMNSNRTIIVGMTGASGVIYGIRLLEVLRALGCVETRLVVTAAARQTITLETDYTPSAVEALADVSHRENDIAASISSGSFPAEGMVIVPCSIKTLAGVAHSLCSNLLLRSADVTLKERRKLIVVPRESPLHRGHLALMMSLAELGAVIIPPMPAFYGRPKSILELVDHTVFRILDQFGIDSSPAGYRRWNGSVNGNPAHLRVDEMGEETESLCRRAIDASPK
jgi:flavin prenyltransferase